LANRSIIFSFTLAIFYVQSKFESVLTTSRKVYSGMDGVTLGIFGRLQVRLDPWQPEFGPEFAGIDEPASEGQVSVDIEIERSQREWKGIDADSHWPREHPVWFIDGIRRVEARVTAKLDGHYSYGAFGAYAVGAVRLNNEEASFERFLTGRVLALCSAD